jgi:hypothetical protein
VSGGFDAISLTQLTESRKRDVTSNHEGGMEVPQLALVLETVSRFVVDDPEYREHECGEQEDGGDDGDEDVLAPRAALPGGLVILIVPPANKTK